MRAPAWAHSEWDVLTKVGSTTPAIPPQAHRRSRNSPCRVRRPHRTRRQLPDVPSPSEKSPFGAEWDSVRRISGQTPDGLQLTQAKRKENIANIASRCRMDSLFAGWTPFAGWTLFFCRMKFFAKRVHSASRMDSNVSRMGSNPAGWALLRRMGSNFAGWALRKSFAEWTL